LLANIIAGLLVGIIVGMTGVGGGALMTPILVLVFGSAPQTAVGTDLLFATLTKSAGFMVHGFRGTVDWQVFRRLSLGSLPAAALTVTFLYFYKSAIGKGSIIFPLIGIAIVITAVGLVFKPVILSFGKKLRIADPEHFKSMQLPLTILSGIVLGVLVSLTSIGAGAIGATMLIYLYPLRMKPATLVGTDIAHAIPLALVAGLGHLMIGNVDFIILRNLLLGSVPGIIIGSHLASKAPDHIVRTTLAAILLLVGIKMLVMR
jgi:uncharacterized membrane protein YfcA